jgi:hypothetical protein
MASAATGAAIFTGWTDFVRAGGVLANPAGLYFISFVTALIICLAAGVFIGLPITWVLMRSQCESAGLYGLVGFIAGALVSASMFGGAVFPLTMDSVVIGLLLGGIPGTIAGSIWWRLVRRPDVKNSARQS